MKKLIFTLTLLTFGLLAQAQIPSYVPTNGLVGWWPFNGNANDESGNGNHGTVNGATLAADRNGNAGKAYYFNGLSSINIPSSPNLNALSGNFTFSIWIKNELLINHLGAHILHISNGNFSVSIPSTNKIGIAEQGIQAIYVTNSSFNNQWTHFLVTRTISSFEIFVNGILDGSVPNNFNLSNVSDPLKLGVAGLGGNNGSYYFKGLLDDIAIYNRALSASEVQQLYLGNSTLNASVTSSVPGKINYQGMAMGTQRKPMKNSSIGLRFSVIDSSPVGAVLFTETLQVTTDSFGIFATQIGGGTTTLGKFENIPWSNGKNKFLKVEMDILGGSNYQTMGTNQLVSVPYALHAGSAEVAKSAMGIQDSLGNHYQISMVNGQLTLVPAPGSTSNPGNTACGQAVTYAGESYPTVQIGNQCWFQKNLNVGTMILGANDQTNNSVLEKYCYNNDTANCAIYGGLYQWAEAVQYQNGASNTASPSPAFSGNVKGICPTGWHVPSDGEWCTITTFLDATVNCAILRFNGTDAGSKMKSTSSLWNFPNTGATNSSGFTALPGGYRFTNGAFYSLGNSTHLWSSSEASSSSAFYLSLFYHYSSSARDDNSKGHGFPIRCLKD
jgi:uncharacterized protein (TIGR02145 family)